MKIEELSRDELLQILTTVKDVSPASAASVLVIAQWDVEGNRILLLIDQKLNINIQDENVRNLLSRYEVAVEMVEARMGART